jgi:cytochrome oxidase assembly protein ShyY1
MAKVLLAPRWLVRHMLILLAVSACLAAGFWQLNRHGESRARNAAITTQSALPPLELNAAPDANAALRRVTASGAYDARREIVLLDRALSGRPGEHRLTPLRLADGSAILVDRGWAPSEIAAGDYREAPEGNVRVSGILLPPERPRPLTPKTAPTGTTTARIDTAGLAPRFPYRLAPVYLLLASQEPAQRAGLPVVIPQPKPQPGPPHLSYAVQWFSFAAIALGGHAILARRALRGTA